MLRGREEGDSVIVALAGHGVQFKNRDESYFCPADAKLDDPETLLALSAVYQELGQCKAGFRLLLVDACRDDPFAANTRDAGAKKFESLSRPPKKLLPGGVAALFSCSAGEKAYEDDTLEHGVFFNFVVEGLKGDAANEATGEVSLPLLEDYVQRRVKDFVAGKYGADQTPERDGKTRGLVALAKYSNGPAEKYLRQGFELAGLHKDQKTGVLAGVTPRGNLSGALEAFDQTIRRNPRSVEAYSSRALVLWSQCRFQEAMTDANKALQVDPKSPAALCARSLVYLGQSKLESALADCEKAIQLDPKCTLAYCNRAFLRCVKWDLNGALADCNHALQLDPAFAVAYCHRSLVYARQGKLEQALADCNRAIQLDGQLPGAYSNRGLVYWAQGMQGNVSKFDLGLADCNRAVELDPNFTPAYTVRALNRLMKQDLQQAQLAMADLEKARQINPNDNSVYLVYGNVYAATRQYDQALAEFNKLLQLNPSEAQAYEGRGDVYSGLRQYARAATEYTRAAQLMPADTLLGKQVRDKLRKLPATRRGETP